MVSAIISSAYVTVYAHCLVPFCFLSINPTPF